MSFWELAETSTPFSVTGIKERMKDKKNGVLKTAKLNASLASKIRTKTISPLLLGEVCHRIPLEDPEILTENTLSTISDNSSIIKVTLKQNNKALALALNAAKVTAQRLADEKMLLQKEVELCNFENASLRQKLSSVTKYIEELQHYMNARLQAAMKLLSRPENGSCSLLLNDAELCRTDNIGGNQDDDSCSSLTIPKPMRIPLSHIDDEDSENGRDIGMGTSTGLQMLPLGIPAPGSGESQERVPTSAVEKSSSLYLGLAAHENDAQRLSEVDGTGSALNLSTIFGDNLSSSAQSSRSCSLSALSKNSPMQHGKVTRPCSDSVVPLHGHVTKRKKHTVDVSAVFDSDSLMEPLDNVLRDGLQGPKEQEATAAECLEVSQVGELVSLGTKSKIFGKIKAKEVKVLNKVSVKTKNRDSSRKSKAAFDNHNDDVAVVSESNKVSSSDSKMKRPKPGESSQLYSPEEPVPWASFSQKEEHSSKHSDKTTDCRTSSVVDQAPSKGVQTFLEKMRNLESQFQNPEAISNNKTQQDEVSHPSQCSNKTRGCRRTYVVVTDDLDHENDCAPSAHKNKKNTHWENKEDLGSLSPSPKSSSLMSKPPLHSFDTQPLADLQKENSSQEEITLGLNVKRLKSKRKTQELGRAHMLSEIDMQSLDINMQFHTQPEESKTKKSHKGKAAKVAKGDTQEVCCRTRVDEFSYTAKSPRLSKRTIKDLKATFLSMSQADIPTVISLGSTASVLPVSLDDEKSPLDNVFRSSAKIQKVQRPAIFQSSSSVTKTNSSLEKTCLGANSHLTDIKKKVDSVPKSSKRSTYTVSDVKELRVASNLAFQHSEEGKNSQGDQARWSFLQVPSSRTQQDSLVVNVTEVPPFFDSLTKGPNIPDSSSKRMSKIVPLDSCSSSSSPSRLSAAKDLVSPGRYSALPKVSAVFNKNYSKQMPSGRHEKKTIQATPQAILQNTAVQENENEVLKEPTGNEVLKDLTNVNSASCNSIPSEDSSAQPNRRRKKEVSYAEPKLNSKLRRGDPFTVTEFLSSPIYKTKSKKSVKSSGKPRKIKKIKVEETEPSSDFVTNQ